MSRMLYLWDNSDDCHVNNDLCAEGTTKVYGARWCQIPKPGEGHLQPLQEFLGADYTVEAWWGIQ